MRVKGVGEVIQESEGNISKQYIYYKFFNKQTIILN